MANVCERCGKDGSEYGIEIKCYVVIKGNDPVDVLYLCETCNKEIKKESE